MIVRFDSADRAFQYFYLKAKHHPDCRTSPRGLLTRELLNVAFELQNPRKRIIWNDWRKISLRYLVGEFLWYLRGSRSGTIISHYSKFWQKILNADGTANSAYGYHLFSPKKYRHCQWDQVQHILAEDRDTRRAVMVLWSENEERSAKDVPCTVSLQFMIRKNRLHLFCNMRSNDLFLGFPYDVACFTLLQEMMLKSLHPRIPKLKLGKYFHYACSLHLYEKYLHRSSQQNQLTRLDLLDMPPIRDINAFPKRLLAEAHLRKKKYS